MSSDSDDATMEWHNSIQILQEVISSDVTKDGLRDKIVSIAISIDAHDNLKLFKWMIDTLGAPSNDTSDLREVLLELIPSITARGQEEILIQCLKRCVERQDDSMGVKAAILSITSMLHSAQGRFQSLPVIQFLSWCTSIIKVNYHEGDCINEIMKVHLSYMAQLDNETDVLHELQAIRSIWSTDGDVESHPSIQGKMIPAMVLSLQYGSIRTAYQSLLLATEPSVYNGLDAIVYLVLCHDSNDTRDDLLRILHNDIVVKVDHRCNENKNVPKEVDGASHILPLIIKVLEEIDVPSFEIKIQSTLLQAASSLGLHLLHSPIHHPTYPALDSFGSELDMKLPIQWIMALTKQYISDLFSILPSENKEQLASALLSLSGRDLGITEVVEEEEKNFWSVKEELMERFPLSIRKIVRVRDACVERKRVHRRHWQDVWTSSIIILTEIVRRYRTVFGMEIIRCRLEKNDYQWFSHRDNSKDCSRMNRSDFEYTMTELNCILLVAYAENINSEQSGNANDTIDLVTIVQRRLFSLFDAGKSKRSSVADRNGVVLGMILSKHLVQSTLSSDEDRNLIVGWVTRIIVNQEESDRLHMDAVLGYWGLKFLCSLCPDVDTADLFSFQHTMIKTGITAQKIYALSMKDVFDRVKILVLSRIGMIQNESSLIANDTRSILGYTKVPRCFQAAEKSKKRRVFCVASFLRRIGSNGIQSTDDIQEWFRFTGCLTGVYLQFASFISKKKCTADSWMLASVELLPYIDTMFVELSAKYRFVHCMGETSLEMEDLDEIDGASVSAFFQSAYTFVIAISIKRSILMNSYKFWKKTAEATKAELLMKLIQYQLAKIYDLNHHLHRIMELVLDFSDQEYEDSNITAEVEKLTMFISSLFHSVSFIPPYLLRDTLQSMSNHSLTKEWDDTIRSILTQRSSSTPLETSLLSLQECLTLESCIALHLKSIMKHRKRTLEQFGVDGVKIHTELCFIPLENIPAAFQFLKMRMLWLPLCKRFYVSDHYLSGSMILRDPMVVRTIADQVRKTIVLHLELIQHTIHEVLCAGEKADFVISLFVAEGKDIARATSPLYQMMKFIMITDDAIIASHMLDLVSLVPQKKQNSSDWIQKVTWQYVDKSTERIEPPEAQILYHLPLPFVRCICDCLDRNYSPQDAVKRSLINLVRLATKRLVDYDGAVNLSHIILTHWSHAISQGVSNFSCNNFNELVDAIDESIKSRRTSKGSLSAKEGVGVLAKLDVSSVPVIFDFALHLVVATVAILGQSTVISQENNPPQHDSKGIFQALAILKTFDKMMNMYSQSSDCFPKSVMHSATNACVLVIKICEGIATKCAKVEIADTLPHKRKSTMNPLKALINGMKEYCCGSVSKVCNIDSSHDGKLLLARGEKMRQFLFTIESSCNLMPSSLMTLPSNTRNDVMGDNPKKAKMNDIEDGVRLGDDVSATSQDDDDSFGVDGDWGDDDSTSNKQEGKLHMGLNFQL